MSRGIYAPSSSVEIYQGCRTPSEGSVFSESSTEPSLSPSPSAREIYEGLMTPDWWQLSQSSGHNDGAVADASEPFAGRTFTIRELAAATNNFSLADDCLLGQGEFGQVYKGRLKTTNQVVAIKRFNNGSEGCRVFHIEVMMQSLLHHPNIVEFIGYCAEGNQKLVVHEYMPLGSLEDHLHFLSSHKKPLDWNTRMNIAVGVAKGLEFLHDKANPPVIFGGLKSSNILLEKEYHPKLSGLGTAVLQPVGDNSMVSTTAVGAYGYFSPEHAMSGELSLKSDIYSFGVVLLEIITSRKAFDNSKNVVATSLVARARSLFKDQTRLELMADPMLQGQYPKRRFRRALAIAAACLEEQPAARPPIARVVAALCYLASHPYVPKGVAITGHETMSSKLSEQQEEFENS